MVIIQQMSVSLHFWGSCPYCRLQTVDEVAICCWTLQAVDDVLVTHGNRLAVVYFSPLMG